VRLSARIKLSGNLSYLLLTPVRFIIIKTMKQCPSCQTIYSDDSLQFCLQDGTPLSELAARNAPINSDVEAETVISSNKGVINPPRQVEPIRFEPPSSYQANQANQANWSQQPSHPVIVEQPIAKKSNTTAIVLLTALGTLLLLGIGGAAAWMYFRNNRATVAVNVNNAPQNRPSNANAANQNANLATPSPTPTPQPTLKPEAAKEVTNDVRNIVDEWKDTTESLDLDSHVSQYADTVDFYKAGRVNVRRVREDRARAFAAYDSISINIDNVKVTPDASGEKATVVLDKEWNFQGEEKFSSGKVQQQLTLAKINGRWLITGEKDLKIYYVDK
jgi:hypothetical protein